MKAAGEVRANGGLRRESLPPLLYEGGGRRRCCSILVYDPQTVTKHPLGRAAERHRMGNILDFDRAEAVLRERGAGELSLRELARDAGVSHGAPRSHFIDRAALLDALTEQGYDRLVKAMTAAVEALPLRSKTDFDLLSAASGAFLDFADINPALLALMVAAKTSDPSSIVNNAAARLVATMTALVTTAVGSRSHDTANTECLTLLLSATVQGIASLVVSGRIPSTQASILLDDAIRVFLAGAPACCTFSPDSGSVTSTL